MHTAFRVAVTQPIEENTDSNDDCEIIREVVTLNRRLAQRGHKGASGVNVVLKIMQTCIQNHVSHAIEIPDLGKESVEGGENIVVMWDLGLLHVNPL